MDKKQFELLEEKLDVLIGLLTISITKGKTLQEQAEFLSSLGLTQGQIASAFGKTTTNIKSALRDARRKKKSVTKKNKKEKNRFI